MTVEKSDLEDFLDLLSRHIPELIMEAAQPAMEAALARLEEERPPYPPRPTGKFEFVSDKQRRYFFWALRNNKIQVPYRRTGQLNRSFTRKVEVTGKAVVGLYGTNLAYAPWVIGPNQAKIHEGRWYKLGVVVGEAEDEVWQTFGDVFFKELVRLTGF